MTLSEFNTLEREVYSSHRAWLPTLSAEDVRKVKQFVKLGKASKMLQHALKNFVKSTKR